jgi:eukaryotic-like serine/threonine-protein kinase
MDHPNRDRHTGPSNQRSSSRWDRLDELFDEASSLPEAERDPFLARACAHDPALRAEVLSLLRHSVSGDVLLLAGPGGAFGAGHPGTGQGATFVDALVGRTVGNYRIEACVGSGGMGVVYRGSDIRLDRPVALKFIWPALSTDPVVKDRFMVEARAAAGLDHPNICTVHEVGKTDDGALFIAMAYYEGETLKERLVRGPLPIEEAVDTVVQIARGVSAAHARGIVHRDIKPGNILVTRGGVAKLLDFGIAKDGESSQTDPSIAMGTAAYMSPERFRGGVVDARSDVWSLGVVLHELLTGRRPFEGDSPAQILHSVLREDPAPLGESRADVPAALEAVVRRALARDPDRRPRSAEELIAELRAATADRSRAGTRPSGRPWTVRPAIFRSRAGRLVLATVTLAIAGSVPFLWRQVDGRTVGVGGPGQGDFPAPAAVFGDGTGGSGPASVAVLAFEDRTAGADGTWFADGIAEEILRELSHIDGLRVSVHSSSFSFRGDAIDAVRVGDTLRVAYLIAGSVRRDGDSIWVTPQLLDGRTGSRLWSETYARPLTAGELGGVYGEVAGQVARALGLPLRPRPEPRRTAMDDGAYEAYLEGRYHLRRFQSGASRDAQELLRSVAYLREVVERSPDWAHGWAVLGEAHHWAAYSGIESDVHYPESRKALERALELDANHAQAHASLGYLLHRWERDLAAAEARFRRALDLDTDQYWFCGYAFFLLWAGRYEEAIDAGRRQEARDPLYPGLKYHLGSSYRCAGQLEDAIAYVEDLLATHPAFVPTRRDLVLALDRTGRSAEALARLEEAPDPLPYWELVRALLFARAGRSIEAEALLDGIDHDLLNSWALQRFPSRTVSPAPLGAAVLVALGRQDDAIEVLRAALDRDPATLLYDRCYPELTTLEADPRYQELLRRTGLPGGPRTDRAFAG